MSIPGSASPLFFQTAAAAAAAPAYELVKSLRFKAGESNYLQKTPSSEGNRTTWTWSCWMKRADLSSSTFRFFSVIKTQSDNDTTALMIDHEGRLKIGGYNNIFRTSEAQFRDPSAWMHIVVNADLGQPTAADKFKAWVNGVSLDWTNTTVTPTSTGTNSTAVHTIGGEQDTSGGPYNFFDGYLAEIHFVDGAALSPTSFGALDSNGVWQAIDFTGSHNHDPSYGLSSSDIVSSTGFQSGEGADKVIDSIDPSSNRAHTVAGNAGETITVTFSPAVTVNTSLEIYAYLTVSGDNEERRARVNGGDWFNPTSTADAYHDLGFTGSLSTIQIQYNGSTNSRSMTMRGIRIDGNFVHTGTTGVNGFHLLDFENESTIGHDSSGSNFDYTAYNFGTSAGAGNDILFDVPTNSTTTDTGAGGEVSGNYPVLNPLDNGGVTLSNGNLDVTNGAAHEAVRATIKLPSSGKWYAEATHSANNGSSNFSFGVDTSGNTTPAGWNDSGKIYISTSSSGRRFKQDTTESTIDTTSRSSDVLQVAYDADNEKLYLGINNTWYNSSLGTDGNPSAGSNPTRTSVANGFLSVNVYNATGNFNAGQRAFTYTAPTGFKALCTTNLPTPTIADGSDHFDVKLRSGFGTSGGTVSGLEFAPDWVWEKPRNGGAASHYLFDTVRGAPKSLNSDTTSAEGSDANYFTAFTSDGFTLGSTDWGTTVNVADFCWNAGSSTVTNTDGSITSSVRANQTAGFSIVTFTGTGANATVGHGLNAEPYLLLTKCRESGFNWAVYHKSKGNTGRLMLNNTLAFATSSSFWNNTTPTNSVFSVGSFFASGNTFVAYCVSPVAGYSAVGSYTANGSSNGPFVHTGFAVAWLLTRRASSTGAWEIHNYRTPGYNPQDERLIADSSGAEASGNDVDFLSNGFKIRNTFSGMNGSSGDVYIYWAVAENPFQANGGLAR